MVLLDAAAQPAPAGDRAGREAAAADGDDVAVGQLDLERAGRREVAAGGDEAPVREQRESVVDRAALDDAVQVQLQPRGAPEQTADRPHRPPVRNARRDSWPPEVRAQEREVAVVPGGGHRRADRRCDEAARGAGGLERDLDQVGELREHDDQLRGRAVDTDELAVRAEAAEDRIAALEEGADRRELGGPSAADGDLTAHRREALDVHDPPLWTCGTAPEDGPTSLPPKPKLDELSSLSTPLLVEGVTVTVPIECVVVPGWLARARPRSAANRTTAPAIAARRTVCTCARTPAKRDSDMSPGNRTGLRGAYEAREGLLRRARRRTGGPSGAGSPSYAAATRATR